MDKNTLMMISAAMGKIEKKDPGYQTNKRWQLLNKKLNEGYVALAKKKYSECKEKLKRTANSDFAKKMYECACYLSSDGTLCRERE